MIELVEENKKCSSSGNRDDNNNNNINDGNKSKPFVLSLSAPTPQNSQTYSNNS